MLLAGKVAIVTGAGSGIGRASALRFAEEGASVVAADLRGPKVEETVAMIEQAGGVAAPCVADVADAADAERMVGHGDRGVRPPRRARSTTPARSVRGPPSSCRRRTGTS